MAPLITLYILGGCVAVAAILFIVMIVLSVARPPQLPPLSLEPPLQRMIRALTPMPVAYEEAPTTQRPSAPARTVAPAPPPTTRPAHALPPVPRIAAPPPAAPAFAPSPFVWEAPPTVKPVSHPALDAAQRSVSRPVYPVQRSRKLRRFVIGLFVITTLAAGAVVAYPALLDPLCDDYVWLAPTRRTSCGSTRAMLTLRSRT
jgi:hypothetical protein